MTRTWLRDVAERTIATYLQTLISLILAGWATNRTDRLPFEIDLSLVQSAAVAAIPAALAVVKGAVAARIPGTVSPASMVEP